MIREQPDRAYVFESLLEELADQSEAAASRKKRVPKIGQFWSGAYSEPAGAGSQVSAVIGEYESQSTSMAGGTDLAPFDRKTIENELSLTSALARDDVLNRRRDFARRNHPDRMPEHLRAAATERMTIANQIVDEWLLQNG